MKGNIGGLLVIAVAAFLILMGIKGSQHALFPQIFGSSASYGVDTSSGNLILGPFGYAGGLAPAPVSGPDNVPAGKGNSCPKGYLYIGNNTCMKLVPVAF